MGGQPSKDSSFRESPSFGSTASSSWDRNQGYGQSSYDQNRQQYSYQGSENNQYAYPPTNPAPQNYPPQQSYGRQQSYVPPPSYAPPPPANYAQQGGGAGRGKLDRRYSRIADNYGSLEEVTSALARAGLESSNLILGIDFTKSNEWTGSKSFHHRSLHHIGNEKNPYEQAISIIGRTLSAFDEDNLIPCFGFGDAKTHDQDVFSFYPDERPCNGFEEALARYREIVPQLRLAGPTSFAPIIEMAMTIVEQSGGQYHVLVIVADGQVTRSVDTADGQLSQQEQNTVDAIVKASEYPLSIILVGVGDGPWDMMKEFDDNIPARAFDNFQFVNFTDIMMKKMPLSRQETEFALTALMEIPTQYKATLELKLLGRRVGKSPQRVPLPPPIPQTTSFSSKTSHLGSFQQTTAQPYHGYETSKGTAPPSYGGHETIMSTAPPESAVFDNQVCAICLSNPKDMAFGCGHQTCCDCGKDLKLCPICRAPIETRIKLYS